MLASVLAVAGMLWLIRSPGNGTSQREHGLAPGFTLTSTDGRQVSLSHYGGRNVLLYFNEGVGCDACFYQTAELEKHASHLDREGITVVPIVVNPLADVQRELARFGLRTPYLLDSDMRVSSQYGVIGTGHHAGLPGHDFVWVDEDGRLRWQGSYPTMFVSTNQLLADMGFAG